MFVGITESSEPLAPATQVSVSGGSISGNSTNGDDRDGGGIAVATGDLAIVGTTISGNSAGVGGAVTSDGGGIFAEEAAADGVSAPYDVSLDDVVFSTNTTNGRGGGMYALTEGDVTITVVSGSKQHRRFRRSWRRPRNPGGYGSSLVTTDIQSNSAPSAGGVEFSGVTEPGILIITETRPSAETGPRRCYGKRRGLGHLRARRDQRPGAELDAHRQSGAPRRCSSDRTR